MIRAFLLSLVFASTCIIGINPSSEQIPQAIVVESVAVQTIRQQVAAGGLVVIPPGVHFFYSPLVLDHQVDQHFPTSLVGGGAQVSILDFTRMADPTQSAVRVDRQWGYRFEGFQVRGSGRKNGGIGIEVATTHPNANGSFGTCSGQSVWDHLTVAGFTTGVKVGDRAKLQAASEMEYRNLAVSQCGTCVSLSDFNTLNHLFTMLQMGDCDYGLVTDGASSVVVQSGSSSSVKNVVFMLGNCDKATIRDYRVEESAVGVVFGTTTTVCQCLIENSQFHQRAGLDKETTGFWAKNCIVLGSGPSHMTISHCNMDSQISDCPIIWAHNGDDGSLTVNNGSSSYVGNLVRVGNMPNLRPGRLVINNVARTDAGHLPKGWF